MGRVEQSCTRRPRKSESRGEQQSPGTIFFVQGRTALPATTGDRDKVRQSKNKAQTEPEQHQESARHESCDTGQGSGTSASPIGTTRRGGLASSDLVRQANSCLLSLSSCWRTRPDWLERTLTFRRIDVCSVVSDVV